MKTWQNIKKLNHLSSEALGMAVRLLITACPFSILFRDVSAAYRFGHDVFYQRSVEAAPGRGIDVRISKRQSTKETAKQLRGLGLIRDTWAFQVQPLFLGRKVRMGGCCLNTSKTIDEMPELLSTAPEKRRSGKS